MSRSRPAVTPRPLLACSVTAVLAASVAIAPAAADPPSDLDLLASWMAGTFSSAVQAADNPEFFDIVLEVAPIWTDRSDGRWLYVEQAVREYRDRPYRQRVYRLLELVPGLFESQVFALPDPAAAVGSWQLENPLADLEPADLVEREGCAILMRRRGDAFIGSTLGSLCTSTLRDAAYATSEVVITADGMVSWDRGFAADGSQVWGSTEGGYIFDRIVDEGEGEAGAETGAEAETGTETEPATGTDTGTGAGSGTETGTGSETEFESTPNAVPEPTPDDDAGESQLPPNIQSGRRVLQGPPQSRIGLIASAIAVTNGGNGGGGLKVCRTAAGVESGSVAGSS